MDGFDDEEIARAIALSLHEAETKPKLERGLPQEASRPLPSDIIEIEDDDDDDDEAQFKRQLQRAIQESQNETSNQVNAEGPSKPVATQMDPPPPVQNRATFPFDRAQLERERLARQKRLRPDIVQATENVTEDDDDDQDRMDVDNERNNKKQRVSPNAVASSSRLAVSTAPRNQAAASSSSNQLFYEGELRQTANMHVDKTKDTRPVFRLSEIISPKEDIVFAIVSAYVINFPWLYTFFKERIPVIVVTQDPRGQESMKEVLPEWIKTTPFLRGGFGCMHMKFMLLFYRTGRLRVVVSTANLIEIDWRDIENSVWVQDVAPRQQQLPYDANADDFASVMIRVLRAVNVAPALITLMRNGHSELPMRRLEELRSKWDFSKVKVKLIPSLAGKHETWPEVVRTGHPALMKAIRDLGLRRPQDKELILECQGSSIGTYSTQWTNEFYCSAQGESAETWLDQSRARRAKLSYPPIKILFPTKGTVRNSVLGEQGGGTMFCRRNQWEAAKFPRSLFHDSKSKRGGILMHSKMIIGILRSSTNGGSSTQVDSDTEPEDDDIIEVLPEKTNYIGWAYVGSHNFTPSAWGTISGSSFNPTLNITNFELGVLLPLRDEEQLNKVACWERPPRRYVTGKDEPWIQSESPYFVEDT